MSPFWLYLAQADAQQEAAQLSLAKELQASLRAEKELLEQLEEIDESIRADAALCLVQLNHWNHWLKNGFNQLNQLKWMVLDMVCLLIWDAVGWFVVFSDKQGLE